MFIISIAAFAAFLYIFILYYFNYFRTRRLLKTIPNVEQYPILGSSHKFSNTNALFANLLLDYPRIYGKSFWLMAGPQPMLFTSELDLVEVVLSSQKHVDKPDIIKVLSTLSENGLIGAAEDMWRRHRKILAPSFRYKVLEDFLKTFNKRANKLVGDLDSYVWSGSIDILPMAKRWSLGQTLETLFGVEVASDDQMNLNYLENIQKMMTIIFQRLINPIKLFNLTYCFTGSFWEERRIMKQINARMTSIIQERKEGLSTRLRDNGNKIASLDSMLQAIDKGELTTKEVIDEMNTLVFAGFETTALTIAYTVYNFADHPTMQQKAYEEVTEILENDGSKFITMEMLSKMKYLELFLKESMRVYTVGGLLPRKLGEDVKWSGLTIPKGFLVVIPLHVIHHDPEIYPEPHKTIPERFTPENSKNRHPYAYVPFSAGPRNCIGLKYAMLTTKVCLAKLLLAYRFVPVGHQLDRSVEMTIISKNGIRVGLRKRE